MDLSFDNIKTELKELDKDGNAETLKGEVAFQNRDALKSIANSANGVTRSNTKWRRCEYVIIGIRENEPVDNDLALKGWKALAYSHGDQTLILQNQDNTWTLYNSKCEVIGGNPELEKLIKKIKALHNLKSSTGNKTMYQQKIYYGAPGTGKSNEIKMLTGEGKDGIKYSKNLTFRTTFHPDSDYSTFVGAYKPMWNKSAEKIVYDFRPQTFIKAYVAAWTHPTERVALVIEEINRGNCAQIFGDIFQLLDRESNGLSKYPIEVDMDMQDFLERAFSDQIKESWAGSISDHDEEEIDAYYSKHYDGAFSKIKKGEILCLPKNLSILATMNTSDQSLFPMDSAFKRRWEWIYQPITKGINSKTGKDLAWKIRLAGCKPIDWWLFLTRINKIISDLTTSEDKQLGYFFCLPDDKLESGDEELTIISSDRFVNKVIFYLWNDVFKDYAFDTKCCKDDNDKEILFAKFYNEDGKSVNEQTLLHFFKTLNIENEKPLVEEILPSVNTLIAEDVPHDNEVTENTTNVEV
ncbi:MAG: AAA family ATPase [Prevotella sp.]|nr:AAA family ATPase [Prevotella sp.]